MPSRIVLFTPHVMMVCVCMLIKRNRVLKRKFYILCFKRFPPSSGSACFISYRVAVSFLIQRHNASDWCLNRNLQ